MPFSTRTMLYDVVTTTLDASGYHWPTKGSRHTDLEDVQYARLHYEAYANTGGASVQVWVYVTQLMPNGSDGASFWLPAGPYVQNTDTLVMAQWQPITEIIPDLQDVRLETLLYGTPNASVTVVWADLQLL